MRFDSSQEMAEALLAEGAHDWRSATRRHEDEASQFGGIIANPDSRKSKGERTMVLRLMQDLDPLRPVCLASPSQPPRETRPSGRLPATFAAFMVQL